MILVGIKKDKFEDRSSGKVIEYGQLYGLEKRDNVRGYAVQIHKVATKFLPELDLYQPGMEVDLMFDQYQKVVRVDIVNESVRPTEVPDLF